MKRVPVPMDVLEHNGVIYSTVDFMPPSLTCLAFPNVHNYRPVHPDWEVVREAPPSLVAAVTAYPWGGCLNIVIGKKAFGLEAHNRGRLVAEAACTVVRLKNGDTAEEREECKPNKEAGNARILVQAKAVIDLSQAEDAPEPYSENLNERVLKRRRFTDFVVVCGGQEFPCLRAVLAEASPVFESMLTSGMREAGQARLVVEDADPSVVQAMLAFVYTGKVHAEVEHAALLHLADRFGLQSLVAACAAIALDNLTPENVVGVARALKGYKEAAPMEKRLWKQLQDKVHADKNLLDALLLGA